MIFKTKFTFKETWLHDGTLEGAIAWNGRIGKALDVGYVYLLGYEDGRTKVGATSYFPERLDVHRRDADRWRVAVTRCMVTRPVFNYLELETFVKFQFEPMQYFGEIFNAPIEDLANFVMCQHLMVVAPDGYGQSRRSVNRFLTKLMAEIGKGLGIPFTDGLQRSVQSILEQHTVLGGATGLSEREAMINALAVIEAHTGLNLSAFYDVLREVA